MAEHTTLTHSSSGTETLVHSFTYTVTSRKSFFSNIEVMRHTREQNKSVNKLCQFCGVLHVNRATFDSLAIVQQVHAYSSSVHKQLTASGSQPNFFGSRSQLDGRGYEDGERRSGERNAVPAKLGEIKFETQTEWAPPFACGEWTPSAFQQFSGQPFSRVGTLTAIINNKRVAGCQ